MGSPADQPSERKALTFEQARGIQVDLEQLPCGLCSHLISLADRNPHAYRVDLHAGAVYAHEVAVFAEIAIKHGAVVRVTAEDCEARPMAGVTVRFEQLRVLP